MPDMQATRGADLSDVAPPSIEDVFSLRRPKDIRAGLSSGIKSVGKGIVGGAVGLLAAPLVGAATDGLPGFAKGVAAGVAGAVLLPVTGVTVGVVQVARGVANQPTAVMESIRGKAWDQEQRTWVEQPNSALTTYDAAATAHWQRLGLLHVHSKVQLDYYALLEVPKDASAEQMKRQYYNLARRHHPDKNAGDPEAHERFQQLGHAYQVLSTPALRKRYDAAGASAVAEVDWLEPGAFFAALFGSEMFEHLVGELAIAIMAKAEDCGSDAPSAAELRALQTARVERLVVLLAALLRRYTEGDVEGFKLAMHCEAERLAGASFGVTLLHCIGRVYSRQAEIYLGGLLGATLARVKLGRDSVRSHFDIANAALRVISHQEKVAAFDRQCEQRRQQQQQQQQDQCQPPEQVQQQQLNQQQQVDQQEDKQVDKQHQQLLQQELAEQQQQQQQCIIEQLDMAVGQRQVTNSDADAACAARAAAEAALNSDAGSPPALDAWDAVWFGNSSSAAAAAGISEHAEKQQQHTQQQRRSSRKGQKAGRLGGWRPRDQQSSKHEQQKRQQQQQAEADMQIPAGNISPHRVGSSTGSDSGSLRMSSNSSDHSADEQNAADSSHFDTSAGCWQPLQQQQQQLNVPSSLAAVGSSTAAASAGSASLPTGQIGAGSNADAAAGAASTGLTSSAACKQAAATATPGIQGLLQHAKLEDSSMGAAAAAAAGPTSTLDDPLQRSPLEDAGTAAAAAAAGPTSTLDDLLQRSQLEDAGLDLMLAAMWAANVVDIQATLGRVCRGVLYDRRVSRAQRRLRAAALRELGAIFCAAEDAGGNSSSQHAKQQMQAAYQAVMARQMAGQEAADMQ